MTVYRHFADRTLLAVLCSLVTFLFAATEGSAQTTPAPRQIPARTLPMPNTVSSEMQQLLSTPIPDNWNTPPKTPEEWKAFAATINQAAANLQPLRDRFGVKSEPIVVNGVKAYMLVDNVLVGTEGRCQAMAEQYAGGHDLKDPMLSPVYGDMRRFPPSILTTGTRDLLLSNTVRVHRKLRQAGVVAELHVYEAQAHGNYLRGTPESKEVFEEMARFFDQHLQK
jgi:hypothetical protein